MRRGLATLILGLSLVVASVAWSGFVMLHTVLDPGRSERLADEMLDNTVLRGAVVDAMADSIEAGLPSGASLPRQDAEAAAAIALDDPRVEAVVRDGIVRVHQNALNGVEEPVTIDPSAFGAATREALVGARPELNPVLPAVPPAAITLPDTGLGFVGDVRDFLERTVTLAALVSLAGAALALVITTDRPSVLRRVALWAFAASAFWLILAYGIPWLVERVMPDSAAVFAAGVDVFLGAMILPALLLAGAGLVLVVLSILWDAAGGRGRLGRSRPARRAERDVRPYPTVAPVPATSARVDRGIGSGHDRPVASAPGPTARRQGGASPVPPAGAGDRTLVQPRPAGPATGAAASPWDRTIVQAPPAGAGAERGAWDRTTVGPTAGPPAERSLDPWAVTQPEPGRHAPTPDDPWAPAGEGPGGRRPAQDGPSRGPRWVEGVGYIDE